MGKAIHIDFKLMKKNGDDWFDSETAELQGMLILWAERNDAEMVGGLRVGEGASES